MSALISLILEDPGSVAFVPVFVFFLGALIGPEAPMEVVVLLAAASRASLLLLMACLDRLLDDYDTSSTLQGLSCDYGLSGAGSLSPGSNSRSVWDSIFFVRIAKCGYEYEQYYAFFPLLPGLLRAIGQVVRDANHAELASVFLINLAFILSAAAFHRLSVEALNDDRLASMATLLYIWSPASVFMSSIYTESIFALFSLSGMLSLEHEAFWLATCCFLFASAVRSNGLLNAWFLLHHTLRKVQATPTAAAQTRLLLRLVLAGTLCALPYVALQMHGYMNFCKTPSEGSTLPTWCSSRLPSIYGHVQSVYWGVGLLKYFQLKQLPNFLLAAPAMGLAAAGCASYCAADPWRFLTLGLIGGGAGKGQSSTQPQGGVPSKAAVGDSRASGHTVSAGVPPEPDVPLRRRIPQRPAGQQPADAALDPHASALVIPMAFHSRGVAAYVLHWGFLAAFALLFMHVQVSTRFLSACPPFYWYAAHLCLRNQTWAAVIWSYFLGFCLLGALLFPNFYPWT